MVFHELFCQKRASNPVFCPSWPPNGQVRQNTRFQALCTSLNMSQIIILHCIWNLHLCGPLPVISQPQRTCFLHTMAEADCRLGVGNEVPPVASHTTLCLLVMIKVLFGTFFFAWLWFFWAPQEMSNSITALGPKHSHTNKRKQTCHRTLPVQIWLLTSLKVTTPAVYHLQLTLPCRCLSARMQPESPDFGGEEEVKYNRIHYRLAVGSSVILLFRGQGLKQPRRRERPVINDQQMLFIKNDSKATRKVTVFSIAVFLKARKLLGSLRAV